MSCDVCNIGNGKFVIDWGASEPSEKAERFLVCRGRLDSACRDLGDPLKAMEWLAALADYAQMMGERVAEGQEALKHFMQRQALKGTDANDTTGD